MASVIFVLKNVYSKEVLGWLSRDIYWWHHSGKIITHCPMDYHFNVGLGQWV